MHSSRIGRKGQITLPLQVRKRLGVTAAPAFGSVKEINAWVRSVRDEEEAQQESCKRNEKTASHTLCLLPVLY